MKKLIVLSLVILLLLPVCACGDPETAAPASDTEPETVTAQESIPVSTKEADALIGETTSTVEASEEAEAEAEPNVDTDSDYSENRTHKKYFTICFDDGITQDRKIIEIFKKYDFYACTFFINTGLYGVNWKQVGRQYNRPDVTHIRFTKKELESGIYDGFDVAVHTLTHKALKAYDKNPKAIMREVENDAKNISEITGVYPTGMAWPGGENDVTDVTKKLVYENTSIRFARGAMSTHSFDLPTEFLMWQPTCSIIDADVLEEANRFLESECTEDMLFFVWGHGYELDVYDAYGVLEELIKMMTEADDIVCVTTTEFYQLFKDQIPSLK